MEEIMEESMSLLYTRREVRNGNTYWLWNHYKLNNFFNIQQLFTEVEVNVHHFYQHWGE